MQPVEASCYTPLASLEINSPHQHPFSEPTRCCLQTRGVKGLAYGCISLPLALVLQILPSWVAIWDKSCLFSGPDFHAIYERNISQCQLHFTATLLGNSGTLWTFLLRKVLSKLYFPFDLKERTVWFLFHKHQNIKRLVLGHFQNRGFGWIYIWGDLQMQQFCRVHMHLSEEKAGKRTGSWDE